MCYKTRKMNTPTRGWLHDGHSLKKKETTTDAHIISEKQEQNKN